MSDSTTQSELSQVLDGIRPMQSQIQNLTLEVKVNQTETREKFNTIDEKFDKV
ncbi:hypothetical protein L3556_07980 [Candidatus Synechococcus calcipolaris G9]|uniref:Uncharacterized protein n=1 Tax=Candidatus Synechococcus calcipolaris G9 TaxID=1497997 RepID=A0ABT6EYJ1_9SYNE|nr:hypothetical protein [Candidatus Synechococcus calcipolaris]MDG2990864.1 hypothetical protein [Candidatus Synechococcus calcipolaris G9]